MLLSRGGRRRSSNSTTTLELPKPTEPTEPTPEQPGDRFNVPTSEWHSIVQEASDHGFYRNWDERNRGDGDGNPLGPLDLSTEEAQAWWQDWRRKLSTKGVPNGLSHRSYGSGIAREFCRQSTRILSTADHKQWKAFLLCCGDWTCEPCWKNLSTHWHAELRDLPWRFILYAVDEQDADWHKLRGLWRRGNLNTDDVEYAAIQDNGSLWFFITGEELPEERVKKVAEAAGFIVAEVEPAPERSCELLTEALSLEHEPLNCRRKVRCSQGLRTEQAEAGTPTVKVDMSGGGVYESGMPVNKGDLTAAPPKERPQYTERFHMPPNMFQKWVEQKKQQGFDVRETWTGEQVGRWYKPEDVPKRFWMVL